MKGYSTFSKFLGLEPHRQMFYFHIKVNRWWVGVNEGILHIFKIFKTRASPSDVLFSYKGQSLVGGGLTSLQKCCQNIQQP